MISSAETGPLINSDSLPWKVLCCLTSEPLIGLDVDGGGGDALVTRKSVTRVLQEKLPFISFI